MRWGNVYAFTLHPPPPTHTYIHTHLHADRTSSQQQAPNYNIMYMWVNYNIVTLVNYKFMLYLPRPDEQPATGT
jgi:hypothetical protein